MLKNIFQRICNKIGIKSKIIIHAKIKGLFDDNSDYKFNSYQLLNLIFDELYPSEIYVPSFTYKFTKNLFFDAIQSPSEVGRFSYEIQNKFAVKKRRTLDPIFSVIDINKTLPDQFYTNTDSFGNNSIWSYLNNNNHYIININLNSPIITSQLHHLEYIHKTPYRYKKNFNGKIKDWDSKELNINYKYFVRDLNSNTEWDRDKILSIAKDYNAVIEEGPVKVFSWDKLKSPLSTLISNNPLFLLKKY